MNIRNLFYKRPSSLGEGMQRIVNKAGKSKNAVLVDSAPGERVYSNGVRIHSTTELNQPESEAKRFEYATYVLKDSESKEIKPSTIYAVKGKTTLYSPESNFTKKEGADISKVIGETETIIMSTENGPQNVVLKDCGIFDFRVKENFAKAFK
ncbi:MAG: hypothetical protein NC200_02870 [Candidatus Gastranaerophilales bacterium]|nr:hypothetical protein [Candidatus Gastranaerophilales bacterium]